MTYLKARQRLGKYRIVRRISEGGFAVVYEAQDTIEGIRVALKVPHKHLVNTEILEDFRHEVRLAARLDNPHILPLKNAAFIDDYFVIAYALGEQSLDDRLQSRLALPTAIDYAEQLIAAVAYAHQHRIIHCDIKPDNYIIFPNNRVRLTDFGISKVAQRTIRASGSGTVGYVAPEQAMGHPSFRSDVFSLGLVLYRMFAGRLPEWPYHWPQTGYERLQKRLHPDFIALIRRAIEVDPGNRYRDAGQMLAAFHRIKSRSLRFNGKKTTRKPTTRRKQDWKTVRRRQFQQQYGKQLQTRHACAHCDGPVSEFMQSCPWCGKRRAKHEGESNFPLHCPRCYRGMKLDWEYCPWCYGEGFEPHSTRPYSDKRYSAKCSNPKCDRKDLMPFMRYCPWCHSRVKKKWHIEGAKDQCPKCHWDVLPTFWSHCPWCSKSLPKQST